MSEAKRTVFNSLKTVDGRLCVIASILATVVSLNKTLRELFPNIPALIWYAVPAILLILIVMRMRGLARRSRLLRPRELLLKVDKTEHLVGRSEDIDRLSKLCTDCQQVHLVGESGAGKSALMLAGLCPELRKHARLIPIYVDVWGQDWESGPRIALASAFWEALPKGDQDAMGLIGPPVPEHLLETIKQCKAILKRKPLFIFDQFDDYQVCHRSKFLPGRRRTWLPADRLVEVNSFWRDIKNLLDDKSIHCLFVTRTDTADGLESVRFVTPQVYRLDRLNVGFVRPLLESLTTHVEDSEPIVYEPEHGWNRLKDRLARDLGMEGTVLPAQMKIAFQGLAGLGTLTIREYERKGGLRGLEAAHVQRHVSGASRNFNLPKPQVRTLLLYMVDQEAIKTIPKSTEDLQKAVIKGVRSDSSRLKQAVRDTLDYLTQREIIRKRLDPGTHKDIWVLDHDYLCRGVMEAEHYANKWSLVAQESRRAFQEAGYGIWRKWKFLLSPWQQITLVCLRLAGRFHYGDLRLFAAFSLIRFIPFVILCGIMIFYFTTIGTYKAWKTIREAEGKLGDHGRKQALEYLHKKGVSLECINISSAHLVGLRLPGANLKMANLAKSVLEGADLSGAKLTHVNLSDANMCTADFRGADLTNANLTRSKIWRTNLTCAELTDANLLKADFSGANLVEAVLVDANCIRADFTSANLSKAKLIRTNLYVADLSGANLFEADLTDANLVEADLSAAKLPKSYLTRANLFKAKLWGNVDLSGANLADANLADANLQKANLAGANLSGVNFFGAYLADANLADVREWQNIKTLEYANVYGVMNVPDGFEIWVKNPEQQFADYLEWHEWKERKKKKGTGDK